MRLLTHQWLVAGIIRKIFISCIICFSSKSSDKQLSGLKRIVIRFETRSFMLCNTSFQIGKQCVSNQETQQV